MVKRETAVSYTNLHVTTNKGKVFDRATLLEQVWRYQGDERIVDVHIRRLREKIEKNPARPEYVLTKWGVGYFFRA